MENDILLYNAIKKIGSQFRVLSAGNSEGSGITVNNGDTWTGTADTSSYSSLVFSGFSSHICTLQVQFSHDNVNWDSTLSYTIRGSFNEVHRLVNTKSYFRVRIINNSGSNATVRFETFKGEFGPLTAPLNGTIQNDADSLIVRTMDFNLMLAEGLYENRGITIKDGYNPDIDTSGLPEDLWDSGGVYTGFIASPLPGQIITNGVDAGTIFYAYLESDTDTNYTFGSIAVTAGVTTYNLGHNIFRCNFAYIEMTNTAIFNSGVITVQTNTGVAFCTIPVGHSQSYCAAYSVPAGGVAFIDRITASVRGGATGQCDGYFFYKPWTKSPILRFPHEYQSGNLYFDDVDYLIRVPEKIDLIPRITASSANNMIPKVSYRVLLTRQLT
jgi:hypothetical protein